MALHYWTVSHVKLNDNYEKPMNVPMKIFHSWIIYNEIPMEIFMAHKPVSFSWELPMKNPRNYAYENAL